MGKEILRVAKEMLNKNLKRHSNEGNTTEKVALFCVVHSISSTLQYCRSCKHLQSVKVQLNVC